MSLKSLECKLAQGQISRYLTGDRLSPEALVDLEAHVAECDDCREIIAERRRTLEKVVASARAVVEVPDSEEEAPEEAASAPAKTAKPSVRAKLLDQIGKGGKNNAKPLILSSALAVVLVAMSYVAKDPTRLFGTKLASSAALPSAAATPTQVKPEPTKTTTPVSNPTPPISQPDDKSTPSNISEPTPKPVESQPAPQAAAPEPKVEVKTSRPKAMRRPAATNKPPVHPKPAGIRVYDESGTPLSGAQ
ncbi:MAG: zf-HC2 domain-containing protein [Fimbriimonadales bacterium]